MKAPARKIAPSDKHTVVLVFAPPYFPIGDDGIENVKKIYNEVIREDEKFQ